MWRESWVGLPLSFYCWANSTQLLKWLQNRLYELFDSTLIPKPQNSYIGAGTVLRQGLTVTGLTTASTLWIVAAVGMACGCGKIEIATVSTILAVGILVLIRIFEVRLMPHNLKHQRKVKVTFVCKYDDYTEVYTKLLDTLPNIIDHLERGQCRCR